MFDKKSDKKVIESLLSQLNVVMGWNYQTFSYPDVENRASKEIDLIAKCEGLPDLAFEETRITSFKNQLSFEDKFKKHYSSKVDELQNVMRPELTCLLPHNLFELDGGDYDDTSQSIINYLIDNQPNFRTGCQTVKLPGLPFEIKAVVSKNSVTKFKFKIYFDDKDLVVSLKKALNHKKEKLLWYSKQSMRAVLVISNYDFQNSSVVSDYQEYIKLAKQGFDNHLQNIFYNDCSESWFCFKGSQELMGKFNSIKL